MNEQILEIIRFRIGEGALGMRSLFRVEQENCFPVCILSSRSFV